MRKIIDSILWITAIVFCSIAVTLGVYGIAHADDLLVEDAGTSGANGCYVDQLDGTWINENEEYWIGTPESPSDIYCILTANGTPFNTGPQYYKNVGGVCTSSNAAGGTYSVDGLSSPEPTITETTCSGPTPPDDDPQQATSSVDQVQQNYAEGYKLFLLTIALGVFIFKRR